MELDAGTTSLGKSRAAGYICTGFRPSISSAQSKESMDVPLNKNSLPSRSCLNITVGKPLEALDWEIDMKKVLTNAQAEGQWPEAKPISDVIGKATSSGNESPKHSPPASANSPVESIDFTTTETDEYISPGPSPLTLALNFFEVSSYIDIYRVSLFSYSHIHHSKETLVRIYK